MRDLELPGRSPVHATNGMAATSHPLSTMTAIRVLQDGGNGGINASGSDKKLPMVSG